MNCSECVHERVCRVRASLRKEGDFLEHPLGELAAVTGRKRKEMIESFDRLLEGWAAANCGNYSAARMEGR